MSKSWIDDVKWIMKVLLSLKEYVKNNPMIPPDVIFQFSEEFEHTPIIQRIWGENVFDHVEDRENKLQNGMRLAQDVAFCHKFWNDFTWRKGRY